MRHVTPEGPRSLFAAAPQRHLSREECEALFRRVVALSDGKGDTSVSITSTWRGSLRWAGNRIIGSADTRETHISVMRFVRGVMTTASINRLDDDALRRTVALAEARQLLQREWADAGRMQAAAPAPRPALFSQRTYDLSAAERASVGRRLVEPSIAAGMRASGFVEVSAQSRAVFNTAGTAAYHAGTRAQYSVTVRTPDGTGSGWAGVEDSDWSRIDAEAVSRRALEKCRASANAKAIEPGRYTVILEPQAVHDLFFPAVRALDRYQAENVRSVYTKEPGASKIGMRLLDDRITVTTDPMDPEAGYTPFDSWGTPFQASTWFDKGVLTELAYDRDYAVMRLGRELGRPQPYSYRMSGGDATTDQLIAGTSRGLLVTRLSDVRVLDPLSLLCTGTTRDGLWLVENGEIKHPIRNFRFNESPMFVFNSIEEIGQTERVLSGFPPAEAVRVPAIKARDFTFTSLADAV